jgi:hypothetical protein
MLTSPAPSGDRAVLEDATGRRGRWMRRLGRTAALLVFGWLVVLLVGGLGLTPVANLPFAEVLRPSQGPEPLAASPKPQRPPADDLRPARPVATPTTAPTVTRNASPPARSIRPRRPIRLARPIAAKSAGSARRAPRRTIVTPARVEPAPLPTAAPPAQTRTASRGRSAQAPGHSASPPPGQAEAAPGHAIVTPGRSSSAPGHVKKAPPVTTTTAPEATTPATHGPKEPKKP